jgi:hypothetical protein
MLSIATASRIIGARPMDEALLLETRYRLDGYRAADRDRLETLGTDVKIKMRNGSLTEDDMLDLQTRYAAAGGRLENYGATLQRWRRGAHTSVINVDARSLSTSHGKHLNLIMGGDHELENLEPPGSQ